MSNRAGATAAWILAPMVGALCILPARAQDAATEFGTIVGLVYDSTRSAPLAGASVAAVGTPALVHSDSTGRFRMDSVPVGSYEVAFFHPRLAGLGVAGPTQRITVVAESVAEAFLAVPSRESILRAWCSAEDASGETSVGGIVSDRLTGVPLPGARVTALGVRPGALGRQRELREVTSEADGGYRLCGLPDADGLTVVARFGSSTSPPLEVGPGSPFVLDIGIHISDPVTITGTVVDYANRAPIQGARVQLVGTDHDVLTSAEGHFGFTGVPPGKQIIQTDQLGYASRVDSLTVFSREALGLEVVLSTEAIVLEPLVVTGRRARDRILTTPGTRFSGLSGAQVDSIAPRVFDFANLARAARVPGLQIYETYIANAFGDPQPGVCIEMTRNRGSRNPNACNMVDVRINDSPVPEAGFFLLEMNPMDVRRIQFISPLEAGQLYGSRGANGVLLIYTK